MSNFIIGFIVDLVEAVAAGVSETPPRCGALGERPCSFVIDPIRFGDNGFKSCAGNLVELPFTRCIRPRDAVQAPGGSAFTDAAARDRLIRDIAGLFTAPDRPAIVEIVEIVRALAVEPHTPPDPARLQAALAQDRRLAATLIAMRALGLQTLSVGHSPNVAVINGVAKEWGVAIDTGERFLPVVYEATTKSRGLNVAVGFDTVVSAFDVSNACIAGSEPAYGVGVSADLGVGGGLVLWYVGTGEFVGFSVPLAGGSVGGGVAGFTARTRLLAGEICAAQEIALGLRPPPKPTPAPAPPEPAPDVVPQASLAQAEVRRGDTLWGIAAEVLGDPRRYPEIFALNAPPLTDPDLILPGQVLTLPPSSDPSPPASRP